MPHASNNATPQLLCLPGRPQVHLIPRCTPRIANPATLNLFYMLCPLNVLQYLERAVKRTENGKKLPPPTNAYLEAFLDSASGGDALHVLPRVCERLQNLVAALEGRTLHHGKVEHTLSELGEALHISGSSPARVVCGSQCA